MIGVDMVCILRYGCIYNPGAMTRNFEVLFLTVSQFGWPEGREKWPRSWGSVRWCSMCVCTRTWVRQVVVYMYMYGVCIQSWGVNRVGLRGGEVMNGFGSGSMELYY